MVKYHYGLNVYGLPTLRTTRVWLTNITDYTSMVNQYYRQYFYG